MTFTGLLILALGMLLVAMAIVPEVKRRLGGRSKRSVLVSLLPPALQYRAYRAYWLGMLSSVTGYQMFRVGQLWLIYQITESPLFLGYVGVANALPGMFFNLFGGVFADKLDKRRLIMSTQATTGSLIFILATLTALEMVEAWHILAVAFLAGAVEAFDTPARQAIYPHLIDRKVMTSAVAMNSVIWQGTRIIAPAIAGFIIDLKGTPVTFYASGVGFMIMATVMLFLRVPPIPRGSKGNPAQDMLEGLRFIKRNSIFSFLISMTFFNSFFGMAYIMLMPVFAVDILDVGARGQGLMLGIGGLGALLTTFYFGSRPNVPYKGFLIIGGAVMFGLLVASFALTSQFIGPLTSRFTGSFVLLMGILFVMGISQSTYMISIQSSLQMMVPDAMRGRVMGFYGMTWSIMPLGGMQASALANFIGASFAIVVGGLAVSGFALGPGLINPKVRNLGAQLAQAETMAAAEVQRRSPSPTTSRH
jgi:MFS family permease